jgi:hypothetical protein
MQVNELRKVCQFAYCMDLDEYMKLFPWSDRFGWVRMTKDFIKWYCDLDIRNSVKFCIAAAEGEATKVTITWLSQEY